jgi:SSS family solute:Na+ symporter
VYGICVANWEWLSIWAFSVLIWVFIPFLLASRVFSAPEFLERRYDGTCRLLFAAMTVLANILAFLAAVLYAAAIGLDATFDIHGWLGQTFGMDAGSAELLAVAIGVLVIGLSTGSYTIFGGLRSVVWTDVFQLVVMVGGGLAVTAKGLLWLGHGDMIAGWKAMIAANQGGGPGLPASGYADIIRDAAGKLVPGAGGYDRLSVWQPLRHNLIPWPNIFLVWLSISVWYNCINQFMIQRVLSAKNQWHARMGIVSAGFLKIFMPAIVVVPGLIMFAMDPHLAKPDQSYPILVDRLIPLGLKGLVLAALLAAVQSTISSVLNSTSTIVTMDIYKRFLRRGAATAASQAAGPDDGRRMARMGQAVSAVVLLVAMALAPFIGKLGSGVFAYIQNLYAHFAPPFSAVFLVGLLWKRANARAAITAILGGIALSILIDLWLSRYFPLLAPFTSRATFVWFVCVLAMVVVSLATARPPAAKVSDQTTIDWRRLNVFSDLGWPWYKNVVLWWAVFLAGTAGVMLAFSKWSGLFSGR